MAKEVLAKKKTEAKEGRYESTAQKPSPLLEDFVDEYFAHYGATRRPGSVTRHRTSWNAVAPVLGDKRLDEITPLDLERYRHKRKQAGKSDVSINRELGFSSSCFQHGNRLGQSSHQPCKENTLNPIRPILITAIHTGLRRSELLALTWDDVDFEQGLITVRAAYAKNGESRSVPMNAMLTRTLEAVTIKTADAVFCKKDGKPYRDFRTAFERAVMRADIPDFTFHDLRHTFASRLVMAGVDLPTVKELMGHKHINMTLRYTHLASHHKKDAVSKLENYGTESHQFSQQ